MKKVVDKNVFDYLSIYTGLKLSFCNFGVQKTLLHYDFCDLQRIYEKLSSLSKHIPLLLIPRTQMDLLCRAKLFVSDSSSFFLCLELSRGTTIAAYIGQGVVDLKLEVK